jgi:hypothetical protein
MSGLTLERSGTQWTIVSSDGPSPRAGHRVVYVPEAGGVVLFGGTTGNPDGEVSETWLRRQGAWQPLSITPAPARRAFHGLVYDSTRSRAVLWGGAQNASQTNFGDHWEFEYSDAIIVSQPQSVSVAAGSTAAFQVEATGSSPQYQWRRNGINLSNSARVEGATAALLQISNVNGADIGSYDCVVTNGCGSVTSSAATLTIPVCDQTWTNQGAGAFGQRWVHAQAYSGVNAGTLLFGGRDAAGDTLSDTWLGTPNGWTRVATTGPSLRTDHAMAELGNGRVLLFGGKAVAGGAASVLGDTWEWNGTQWNLLSVTGPSPRLGHQMVLDTARDRVVLFGGIDATGATVSDTWEWNGAAWSLVSATGPAARFAHAMAFDATNGETLVIGGYANSRLGDTWAWNGSAWRQTSDSGFSPTYYATAAYDDTLGRVFMFGGWAAAGVNNGLLAWDGTAWTTVNLANAPSPRWTHAMSYDRASRAMIVTGGAASPGFSPIYSDFSTLSIMPIAVGQPQDQTLIPGGTATFSVSSSRPNTTFQWKKNGVNLNNDARVSGATGPTLVISNLQSSDGGSYTCELTTVCGSNVSGAAGLSCRPTFAQQPVGGTFEPGSVVTLSTQVSTVGSTFYRWHRNGAPLFNGPVYAGASSPTLQFTGSDPSLAGTYSLLVTNSCGTRWSSDAVVLLSFPTCDSIDFNNDGSIFDPVDIDAFLSVYSEGPCIPATATCNDVDFNNDASVFDPCDVDTFLTVFSEGLCAPCGL